MTASSNAPCPAVPSPRLMASAGPMRLVIGLVALGALAFGLAQANRLPGALGATVRGNLATDRDATALFYTEVEGWNDWRVRP